MSTRVPNDIATTHGSPDRACHFTTVEKEVLGAIIIQTELILLLKELPQ